MINSTPGFIQAARCLGLAAALSGIAGCEIFSAGSILMGCAFRSSPHIEPRTLPEARIGVPYRVTLEVVGAGAPVASMAVSSLPSGLQFEYGDRESQGYLEGTPREAGSFSVTASAGTLGTMCVGQSVHQAFELNVTD